MPKLCKDSAECAESLVLALIALNKTFFSNCQLNSNKKSAHFLANLLNSFSLSKNVEMSKTALSTHSLRKISSTNF